MEMYVCCHLSTLPPTPSLNIWRCVSNGTWILTNEMEMLSLQAGKNFQNARCSHFQGNIPEFARRDWVSIKTTRYGTGISSKVLKKWISGGLEPHPAVVQLLTIPLLACIRVKSIFFYNPLKWPFGSMRNPQSSKRLLQLPHSELWALRYFDGDDKCSGRKGNKFSPIMAGFLIKNLLWDFIIASISQVSLPPPPLPPTPVF
jgi:hypothetical protein